MENNNYHRPKISDFEENFEKYPIKNLGGHYAILDSNSNKRINDVGDRFKKSQEEWSISAENKIKELLDICYNYKKQVNQDNEIIIELHKFIEWYSGMEKTKIEKAFQRFKREQKDKNNE